MALIVKVYINDRLIAENYAVRIKGKKSGICTYRCGPAETILKHNYGDGGVALAIALLKQIENNK